MDHQRRCEMLTRENEDLRDRVAQLEEAFGLTYQAPAFLGLSGSEARMFGILMARNEVTKSAAMIALYGLKPDGDAAQEKIIDVYVCKMRKKLKHFDVVIETNWGQGYCIPVASKARVRNLIAENTASAA